MEKIEHSIKIKKKSIKIIKNPQTEFSVFEADISKIWFKMPEMKEAYFIGTSSVQWSKEEKDLRKAGFFI